MKNNLLNNRIIKTITILIYIFLLSSCTTKRLWENPSYEEIIESYFITEDGKKLAIIGEKYHYIVPITSELKKILLSKSQFINPLFHSFKVDKNNNITGKYRTLNHTNQNKNNIPPLKKEDLAKKNHHKEILKYSDTNSSIVGKRYIAKKINKSNYKFKKTYYITVEEEPSQLIKTGKILVSPITVTADGAMLLVGIALALIIDNPEVLQSFH
ncbi:MAG: hypothetical protein V3U87_14680 [Methylococcaceae bacterium]